MRLHLRLFASQVYKLHESPEIAELGHRRFFFFWRAVTWNTAVVLGALKTHMSTAS